MKIFVERCVSKSGSSYFALKCDFGYRVVLLNMEQDICAEILGLRVADLFKMKEGEKREVKLGLN